MSGIIRILDGIGMKRREFRFNRIEPRSIGGDVDRFHVASWKVILGGPDIRRQIVHDHVNAYLDRVTGSQLGKTRLDVFSRFALADASH